MTPAQASRGPLRELARLYGAQTAYYDVQGRRRAASADSLLRTVRALGALVAGPADVPSALRERRQQLWRHAIEPVVVVWHGRPAQAELRVPAALAGGSADCELSQEDGQVRAWRQPISGLLTLHSECVEGIDYVAMRLDLPRDIPFGYHHLSVILGGARHESLIVSAPQTAYRPDVAERGWGLLMPLYALHSARSWGAGDFSDLRAFTEWMAESGGSVVATLPFLAAFLDEPFEPSPYVPVSRLFWNEFCVDVTAAPEISRCDTAQATIGSARFQREQSRLRSAQLIDYKRVMALKRRVLEDLARCFFADRSQRYGAFKEFLNKRPEVEDYARFRAVGERLRTPWPEWREPLRDGEVGEDDYDQDVRRYHLYAQWLAHEQLEAVGTAARARNVRLHLDLPLGTHPAGYDGWREQDLFPAGASAGAPPDMFFQQGQNWQFKPINPWSQRDQGYRYFRACLQHHLQYAGSLRVDHVMGLHRLYWIPSGMSADEGVYVRYPAGELYAILCLESQRHNAVIVGEDLGTVPRAVRSTMGKHGIRRSYVFQIEPAVSEGRPLGHVPAASVASLNTHDTPPFAAYWRGVDIDQRRALGLLPETEAVKERRYRRQLKTWLVTLLERRGLLSKGRPGEAAVLRASLAHLSASRAATVLVNLEDLWLESASQNVPGTSQEHPNWRRKGRYAFEEFRTMPQVVDVLRQIDRVRKNRSSHGART